MNNPKKAQGNERITKELAILWALPLLTGGTLTLQGLSSGADNGTTAGEKRQLDGVCPVSSPLGGGGGTLYSVTLPPAFQPVQNWKVSPTDTKQVSVSNEVDSPNQLLVRLALQEWMQTRRDSEGTIKNHKGNAVLFATVAEGENIGQYLIVADAQALVPNHATERISYEHTPLQ